MDNTTQVRCWRCGKNIYLFSAREVFIRNDPYQSASVCTDVSCVVWADHQDNAYKAIPLIEEMRRANRGIRTDKKITNMFGRKLTF